VSGRVSKVHFDYGGRARCGNRAARQFTADREQVTCRYCANLLDGTHHVGVYHCDVEPHGTPAAARRHYRNGDRNLRFTCPPCWHAEHHKSAGRYARRAGA